MSPQGTVRPEVAPPEEDPNATVACSSPPCFLHELDPSWLGYLGCAEIAGLLDALLAADWGGMAREEARLRAMLRQRREALGAGVEGVAGLCQRPGGLIGRLREALPRIEDEALRRDLAEVLRTLESGLG